MKKATKYTSIILLLILLSFLTYSFTQFSQRENKYTNISFFKIGINRDVKSFSTPIEIENYKVKKQIYNKLKHFKLIKHFDRSINSYIYLIDIINYANHSSPILHIGNSEKLFSAKKCSYHLINAKDIYSEIIKLIKYDL